MRTPSVLRNQQKMQLMDSNSSSWEIEKKQGQQGDRIKVFFLGVQNQIIYKMCILSLKETIEGG